MVWNVWHNCRYNFVLYRAHLCEIKFSRFPCSAALDFFRLGETLSTSDTERSFLYSCGGSPKSHRKSHGKSISSPSCLIKSLIKYCNSCTYVLLILNICRLQSGSVKIPLQITTKSKHGTTKSYITMSSYSNMTKHNNNPTNGTSPTYEETDMITNGDNSNSPSSPTSNQQFKTTKFSGKKTLTSTSSWPLQKANKSCHFSDDDFLWIVE